MSFVPTPGLHKQSTRQESLMPDLNLWAIVVAAIVSFLAASAYYAVFGSQLAALTGATGKPPPAWVVPIAELGKGLVIAFVVAWLAAIGSVVSWPDAVVLGLALWIAFPVMLLISSMVHEGVSAKLAGLHAGDWLVKLLVIALVVSIWR
jgi:hypothetical protein